MKTVAQRTKRPANGSSVDSPLFHIDRLTVGYNGHKVLRDVSFAIERGERVALIGRSGVGKTTLLQHLFGLRRADAALVPQDLGLVRALSVFHNIFMGRLDAHPSWYNLANLARPFRREIDRIRPIADRLGLGDKLFTPVHELSGGQQQRTAVARALFNASPIFFGDEPVSSIDEHQSHDLLRAIVDTHETVVLSMHDVSLALEYSGRVIGLKDGQIAFDLPTTSVKAHDLDELYRR
jgi:phosphonate transport system ATP-binding protein